MSKQTKQKIQQLILFREKQKGTDSCESPFGLLSVVVVVGQIVSNSLSILHNSGEDQLQVVELTEKIYHNSTLFLTAREKRGKRSRPLLGSGY